MKKKPAIAFFISAAAIFAAVLVLVFWPAGNNVPVARGKSPAAPITQDLTPEQVLAQDLALSDTRVQSYTLGKRSEVMGVQPVGMHFTEAAAACATANCQQVNIYNYDDNATITTLVNVDSRQVLDVLYQPDTQVGVNSRLAQRAIEIIYADQQISQLLGRAISVEEIMPMDASMNDTTCGSTHQCAGATFFAANNHDILWVMVDMTDEKIVGYHWTNSDPNSSEEAAPYVTPDGCPPAGNVNRDGWTLNYETTGSDALRVYDAYYNGQLVLKSVKLVEWHADYGSSGYRDSTGCGGGGGFPIYPYGNTVVSDLMAGPDVVGFEVVQDFRMGSWGSSCNYRYEQHVQFYTDGRFRVSSLAYGKGCGTNSMYRPVVRIDVAVDGDSNDQFSLWNGTTWVDQNTEFYRTPYAGANGPHSYDSEGAIARVGDTVTNQGYYIVPDEGQFGTNSRGDDPFLYVTQHKPAEGDTDLAQPIGQCCLDDHQQGPDLYVNAEPIDDRNLVIWYVPQMLTDVTPGNYYCWTVTTSEYYPCWGGPMFVPYSSNSVEVMPGQAATYTANHPSGSSTTLSLPAGSVNITTTLVYTALQTASTVPTNWLFGDHAFELNAYQNNVLMPGFVFNLPMNVSINYTEAGVTGIDEDTLVLMYWTGSAWADAATTCSPTSIYIRNTANNTLSVNVCHLTEFALFGEALEAPSYEQWLPFLAKN